MGVYIKGMEMPDSCSNCELCGCYNESKGEVYRCDISMHPIKYFEKRLPNCPLVFVPPHGDLIDRDGLACLSWKADEVEDSFDAGVLFALDYADQLPVIIPAEEGET